jgi:hypothetical protein
MTHPAGGKGGILMKISDMLLLYNAIQKCPRVMCLGQKPRKPGSLASGDGYCKGGNA